MQDPLKELDSALSDDLPGALKSAAAQYGLKQSSGYRTPQRNAAVGGAVHSHHLSDTALDFSGDRLSMRNYYNYVKGAYGDKLAEVIHGTPEHRDHVHVAWNGKTNTSSSALNDLDVALGSTAKPSSPSASPLDALDSALSGKSKEFNAADLPTYAKEHNYQDTVVSGQSPNSKGVVRSWSRPVTAEENATTDLFNQGAAIMQHVTPDVQPNVSKATGAITPLAPVDEHAVKQSRAYSPPTPPQVQINVGADETPDVKEIGRRVYKSLGFTDSEAEQYAKEMGASDAPSAFYSGYGDPDKAAQAIKQMSYADPMTLGRVSIPGLNEKAIAETSKWLADKRKREFEEGAAGWQESTKERLAALSPEEKQQTALSIAQKRPLTDAEREVLGITSPPVIGDVGTVIRGAGTALGKTMEGFAGEFGNPEGPIGEAGKYLSEQSRIRENLYGRRGELGEFEKMAGRTVPAIALRNPGAIAGQTYFESKGEGASTGEAATRAALSYGGLKGAGAMAGEIAPALESTLARKGVEAATLTGAPLLLESAAGRPPENWKDVGKSALLAAGLTALGGGRERDAAKDATTPARPETRPADVSQAAAPAVAQRDVEPPIPADHVRLYRGEGQATAGSGSHNAADAGRWFTDNRAMAEDYAEAARTGNETKPLQYVDVPKDQAASMLRRSGEAKPNEYVLSDEHLSRAADLTGSGKTIAEEPPHHSNFQPRDEATKQFVEGKPQVPSSGINLTPFDDLPSVTKDDLISHLHENVPSLSSLSREEVKDNLFDQVDPPLLEVSDVPLSSLKLTDREISEPAVSKYKQMLTNSDAPPILIADGKVVEGGHRAKAYMEAGRKTIPAVDITPLLNMDWDGYLAGGRFEAVKAEPATIERGGDVNESEADRSVQTARIQPGFSERETASGIDLRGDAESRRVSDVEKLARSGAAAETTGGVNELVRPSALQPAVAPRERATVQSSESTSGNVPTARTGTGGGEGYAESARSNQLPARTAATPEDYQTRLNRYYDAAQKPIEKLSKNELEGLARGDFYSDALSNRPRPASADVVDKVKAIEDAQTHARAELLKRFGTDSQKQSGLYETDWQRFEASRYHESIQSTGAQVNEPTGLKKSVVNAEREARGADPIDEEGARHWGPLWDKVKSDVASGDSDPLLLAKELNKTKRPVMDEEVATLLHGKRRTTDRHREAMTAVEDAIAKGDETAETAARVRAGLIEADRDAIEQATRGAVRENARGLSMMRGMVKEDYSLVNMLQRAKVARGEELPSDVRAKLETLSKQLQEKDAALEKQAVQLADLQAQKSIQRTIDDEKRAVRSQRRGQTKVDIDKEWGDLQADFDAWAKKAVSTTRVGIDPEGVKIIAKMAKNRIRAGINTAEGLVDDIYNRLKDSVEGLEKRDVRDAISGYGVTAEPTKNDLSAQLSELKRQMRVVSGIEDAQRGQRPAKSGFQRVPESVKVKELRGQLDEVMKAQGMRKEMSPEQKAAVVAKNLESDIADLDRRIKEQDFSAKPTGPKVTNPEIENLRARRVELQTQYDALKPEAAKRQMTDEQRLKAVKTRLQGQIADYQKRLNTGDYSKPAPRSPVAYDPAAKRLEADRNRLRQQVESEIAKQEKLNRHWTQKTADFIVKFHQEVVLSSSGVFTKLSSAALGKIITQPAEQALNSAWAKVMPSVAERAPIESGFSKAVEGDVMKRTFSKETLREMRNELPVLPKLEGGNIASRAAIKMGANKLSEFGNRVMKGKGGTDLAALHDPDASLGPEEIRFFGHIHGALKVPAKINTFYRALGKQTEFYTRQQIAKGATPEEAQAYVQQPIIQQMMAAKAYQFAQRNILLQENAWSSGFRRLMNLVHNAGEEKSAARLGGRTLEFVGGFIFPVVKVAPNFVYEAASYTPFGGFKAAVQGRGLIKAKLEGAEAFQKALKKLTPDEADYIMRNTSKATLGTALLTLGFFMGKSIGGYYSREDAKDKNRNAPDFGGMTIDGWKVPKALLHTPSVETLQMGATIRHIYDKARQEKHGVGASLGIGVAAGGVKSAEGLAEEIPFLDQPFRLAEDIKRVGLPRAALKQVTTGFIPPDVQKTSRTGIPLTGGKLGDLDRRGEPVKRAPSTAWQDVKNVTPVLRRSVPQR